MNLWKHESEHLSTEIDSRVAEEENFKSFSKKNSHFFFTASVDEKLKKIPVVSLFEYIFYSLF